MVKSRLLRAEVGSVHVGFKFLSVTSARVRVELDFHNSTSNKTMTFCICQLVQLKRSLELLQKFEFEFR